MAALRLYVERVFRDIPEIDTSVPFFDYNAAEAIRVLPAYILSVFGDPEGSNSIVDGIALRVSEVGPLIDLKALTQWQLVALRELLDISIDICPSKISVGFFQDAVAIVCRHLTGKIPKYDPVRCYIEHYFADTPYPGDEFDEISSTKHDEDIVEYFRGTTWSGHAVQDLRTHVAALSFFTNEAHRYWCPAFMFAELEDSEAADVIADHLVFDFIEFNHQCVTYIKDELREIGRAHV